MYFVEREGNRKIKKMKLRRQCLRKLKQHKIRAFKYMIGAYVVSSSRRRYEFARF